MFEVISIIIEYIVQIGSVLSQTIYPKAILRATDKFFNSFRNINSNTFNFDVYGNLRWAVIFQPVQWDNNNILNILEQVKHK